MKIGFIGLGVMGRPMALNLKAAGHELFIPDRHSLTPELRESATVLGDAAAVAEHAEVVILMVPDTPDVEAVLFGPRGVAEGLRKGTLVIDMSSIVLSRRLREYRVSRLRVGEIAQSTPLTNSWFCTGFMPA